MKLEEQKDQYLGTRWEEAVKMTGSPPPMPKVPPEAEPVIEWFRELRMCRNYGMGDFPIPMSEIAAYGQLTGGMNGNLLMLLYEMSVAFVTGRSRGKDAAELPFWPPMNEEGQFLPDDYQLELEEEVEND